jgi:hypothetical protein
MAAAIHTVMANGSLNGVSMIGEGQLSNEDISDFLKNSLW